MVSSSEPVMSPLFCDCNVPENEDCTRAEFEEVFGCAQSVEEQLEYNPYSTARSATVKDPCVLAVGGCAEVSGETPNCAGTITWLLVDSGACLHVCPPWFADHVPLQTQVEHT